MEISRKNVLNRNSRLVHLQTTFYNYLYKAMTIPKMKSSSITMIYAVQFIFVLISLIDIQSKFFTHKSQSFGLQLLATNPVFTTLFSNNNLNSLFLVLTINSLGVWIIYEVLSYTYFLYKLKPKLVQKKMNSCSTLQNINFLLVNGGLVLFISSATQRIDSLSHNIILRNLNLGGKNFINVISIIISGLVILYSLFIAYLGFVEDIKNNSAFAHRNTGFIFVKVITLTFFAVISKFANVNENTVTIYLLIGFSLGLITLYLALQNPFYIIKMNYSNITFALLELFGTSLVLLSLFSSIYIKIDIKIEVLIFFFGGILVVKLCQRIAKKHGQKDINVLSYEEHEYNVIFYCQYIIRSISEIVNFSANNYQNYKKSNEFAIKLLGEIRIHRISCQDKKCFCGNDILNDEKTSKKLKINSIDEVPITAHLLKRMVLACVEHSEKTHIETKLFYLHVTGCLVNNFQKAILDIKSLEHEITDLRTRYRIYCLKQNLLHEVKVDSRDDEAKVILKMNVDKVVFYENTFKELKIIVKAYIKALIEFFGAIKATVLDLDRVERNIFELERLKMQYIICFDKIKEARPVQIFDQAFRDSIMLGQMPASETNYNVYLHRASIKTKLSSINGDEMENTGYFMVDTNSRPLGKIFNVSHGAYKIIGFTSGDLNRITINNLIPYTIRQHHDSFLVKYLNTGIANFTVNQMNLFILNKAGFLVPVMMRIKKYFDIAKNRFLLLAYLTRKQMKDELIFVNSAGKIEGYSQGIIDTIKWRNYDMNQAIYIQYLMPFISDFFRDVRLNFSRLDKDNLNEFIKTYFDFNIYKRSIKAKIYIDESLNDFSCSPVSEAFDRAKKEKEDAKLINIYDTLYKTILRHAQQRSKKFLVEFEIEGFPTPIDHFFIFRIKKIEPMNINPTLTTNAIVDFMFKLSLIKAFVKHWRYMSKKGSFDEKPRRLSYSLNMLSVGDKKRPVMAFHEMRNPRDSKLKKKRNSTTFKPQSFIKHLLTKKYIPNSYIVLKYIGMLFPVILCGLCVYIMIMKIILGNAMKELRPFSSIEIKTISNGISGFILSLMAADARTKDETALANNFSTYADAYKNQLIDNYERMSVSKLMLDYLPIGSSSYEEYRVDLTGTDINNSNTFTSNIYDVNLRLQHMTNIFAKTRYANQEDNVVLIESLSKHYNFLAKQNIVERFNSSFLPKTYITIGALISLFLVLLVVGVIAYIKICRYIDSVYMLVNLCKLPKLRKSIETLFKSFGNDNTEINDILLELKNQNAISDHQQLNRYVKDTKRLNKNLFFAVVLIFGLLILFLGFSLSFRNDIEFYSKANDFHDSVSKSHLLQNLLFSKLLFPETNIEASVYDIEPLKTAIYVEIFVNNQYTEVLSNLRGDEGLNYCDIPPLSDFTVCETMKNGINTKGYNEMFNFIITELQRKIRMANDGTTIHKKDLFELYLMFGFLRVFDHYILEADETSFYERVRNSNSLSIKIVIALVLVTSALIWISLLVAFNFLSKRIKLCVSVFQLIPPNLFLTNSRLKAFMGKMNGA